MDQLKLKKIRLHVVEQQEIYRHLYQIIPLDGNVELLNITESLDMASIKNEIKTARPDVLLVGASRLSNDVIEVVNKVREEYPGLGMVLLLLSYSTGDVEIMRRFAMKSGGGLAIFLRQSLVHMEQLTGIIHAASYGQFILDPSLANNMFSLQAECPFLKQLTNREKEILGLLSNGYSNGGIADTLYVDVKTVEHHLNSIYSKLRAEADVNQKHMRVAATRIYLQETGALVS